VSPLTGFRTNFEHQDTVRGREFTHWGGVRGTGGISKTRKLFVATRECLFASK
jgi:hypothetical protein